MREAFLELVSAYNSYIGSGRFIVLFLCGLCFIYYLNTKYCNEKRRRISPTVFLLSMWSAIAYSFTMCISLLTDEDDNKNEKDEEIYLFNRKWFKVISVILTGAVATAVTGGFVFTEEAYKESIYYYTSSSITIASILAIISFFVIYFLIASELFDRKKDRLIFMISVLFLHLFANYSTADIKLSIFLYPLSVGSVILHDFMPFGLWLILVKQRNNDKQTSDNITDKNYSDDYEEEWDLKKHKIINIRNMAIAFLALAICLVSGVFVLNSKINNLYNVTVSLEKATEDKVSLYEFKKTGTDDVIATLMITGQGTSTLTGGGSEETGQELYDFITSYTTDVDNWYVYGEDDENIGGLAFCRNKGMIVNKIYLLTGMEKLGENN